MAGLNYEAGDLRIEGRPKGTCKVQVEDERMKVGLSREDVFCRSWCVVAVSQIAAGLR